MCTTSNNTAAHECDCHTFGGLGDHGSLGGLSGLSGLSDLNGIGGPQHHGAGNHLYPNLTELFSQLLPPLAQPQQGQQQEGSQGEATTHSSQASPKAVNTGIQRLQQLLSALFYPEQHASMSETGSEANNGPAADTGSAPMQQQEPSAEPSAPPMEDDGCQTPAQGQRDGTFEGATENSHQQQQNYFHQYYPSGRGSCRSHNGWQQSQELHDPSCRILQDIMWTGVHKSMHMVGIVMLILPVLLLPSRFVALGLFLGVASAVDLPMVPVVAAGLLHTVLSLMDPLLLSLLAVYVVTKKFVFGKPIVDRQYWRRRFSNSNRNTHY